MKSRSFASLLLLSSLVFACGGAVEPVGSSQGPSPSPSGTVQPAPTGSATGIPTPTPLPPSGTAWNAQASGCANVFVFDTEATGTRFLVISGDKATLGLQTLGDSYTADLSQADPIHVYVDTFQKPPQREVPYCTDIAYPDAEKPVKSRAIQGTATITITSLGRDTDVYAVDVTLKGVMVKGPNGALETIPDMTLKSVSVGWLPG